MKYCLCLPRTTFLREKVTSAREWLLKFYEGVFFGKICFQAIVFYTWILRMVDAAQEEEKRVELNRRFLLVKSSFVSLTQLCHNVNRKRINVSKTVQWKFPNEKTELDPQEKQQTNFYV